MPGPFIGMFASREGALVEVAEEIRHCPGSEEELCR